MGSNAEYFPVRSASVPSIPAEEKTECARRAIQFFLADQFFAAFAPLPESLTPWPLSFAPGVMIKGGKRDFSSVSFRVRAVPVAVTHLICSPGRDAAFPWARKLIAFSIAACLKAFEPLSRKP